MSPVQETLFDLLLNALLQIGFFAIATAVFSRLVAKARAKYQYVFYLAVFLFCLAAPVINTIWQSQPITGAGKSLQLVLPENRRSNLRFWGWQGHSEQHEPFTLGPKIQTWIVAIWGVLVLYRLLHFSRGVHRVKRLLIVKGMCEKPTLSTQTMQDCRTQHVTSS